MKKRTAGRRRTGGEIVVDALRIHGIETVFSVPGESFLGVLDALYGRNDIRVITCRHEGGAVHMASAYARVTGKPGVIFVSRGPGACHATIGLHNAQEDSTPLVLLVGQVPRYQEYRDPIQEMDYRKFLAPLCKWVVQVERPNRIPELMKQAFQRACAGRAGPVAVALPEDMQTERTDVADTGPYVAVEPGAEPRALREMQALLSRAKRPFVIAGGGGWTPEACADLEKFAAANRLPVGAGFRCQDRIDNASDCYIGPIAGSGPKETNDLLKTADLVLAIGTRLDDDTTDQYALLEVPVPKQKLIQVFPDPDEIGRAIHPTLPICAGVGNFLRAATALKPVDSARWAAWTKRLRQVYVSRLQPTKGMVGRRLDMTAVMKHLGEVLPPEAIITTDAGTFSGWVQRFHRFRRFPTHLGPTSGSMGYAVPAAVGASLAHPDRPVIGFCGDGGALMTGQEIATAVQYGVKPIIIVVNNNMYGSIRVHQERDYPRRVVGTDLVNPDFAAWAKSFGAHGETVRTTKEFAPAFARARKSGRPAVLELRVEPELITTDRTIAQLRGIHRNR
ncbi:MAG: thiamine pyrophosphate-binding protein [Rhodospirillales bacterium]|nr:thiamine pyrophosphate-binding protein [Rhodospirillales bacterium]